MGSGGGRVVIMFYCGKTIVYKGLITGQGLVDKSHSGGV
jgi:hypothetical protein